MHSIARVHIARRRQWSRHLRYPRWRSWAHWSRNDLRREVKLNVVGKIILQRGGMAVFAVLRVPFNDVRPWSQSRHGWLPFRPRRDCFASRDPPSSPSPRYLLVTYTRVLCGRLSSGLMKCLDLRIVTRNTTPLVHPSIKHISPDPGTIPTLACAWSRSLSFFECAGLSL